MGCLFAKPAFEETIIGKTKTSDSIGKYSWDQRAKVNPKDFTIENVKNETVGRMPGSVDGQQFIIQNCQESSIFIFDHSNTVTVDDCTKCHIFLGPVKGSVFLRNCQECKCVIACQQFRTRDCRKMDVFLACTTQPIIESSANMKFGCFRYNYPELEGQFSNAGLSEFTNNWSSIHDFTPMEGECNWSLISDEVAVDEAYFPRPSSSPLSEICVATDVESSFVPQTAGMQKKLHDDSCLVVFFSDGQSHKRAKSFIQTMKAENASCLMINSKEVRLEPQEAEAVFNTDSYARVVGSGPLIGLEYNGPDCIGACQAAAMNIATETGSTGLMYVSSSSRSASKQIDVFFNYSSMFM